MFVGQMVFDQKAASQNLLIEYYRCTKKPVLVLKTKVWQILKRGILIMTLHKCTIIFLVGNDLTQALGKLECFI